MKCKEKLKSQTGFSLAETLLAVLILLLVSLIVANGVPTARNVYNNVIIGANAQTLLSTAVTALRNELGMAQDVKVEDRTTVTYFNTAIQKDKTVQFYSQIFLNSKDGPIMLEPYMTASEPHTALSDSMARDLISKAASNKNLLVTYESAETDKEHGVIIFHGLKVAKDNDADAVIASLEELTIRPISVSPDA